MGAGAAVVGSVAPSTRPPGGSIGSHTRLTHSSSGAHWAFSPVGHMLPSGTLLVAHLPRWLQNCIAGQDPGIPAMRPTRHSAQVLEVSEQMLLVQSSSCMQLLPIADLITHTPRSLLHRKLLPVQSLLVWHCTHLFVMRLHVSEDRHCSSPAHSWPRPLRILHTPSSATSQNWILLKQSCEPSHCTHVLLKPHLSEMHWLPSVHLVPSAPFSTHLRSALQ